jgi:hypothetical protein
VPRAANYARENSPWCIISSETSLDHKPQENDTLTNAEDDYVTAERKIPDLDHSSAIVTNKRLDVLTVSHFLQNICKKHRNNIN